MGGPGWQVVRHCAEPEWKESGQGAGRRGKWCQQRPHAAAGISAALLGRPDLRNLAPVALTHATTLNIWTPRRVGWAPGKAEGEG